MERAFAGQCVRVVPVRVKEGALEEWLAAHRAVHTPAVRRQPGFVAKVLMQAEAQPEWVVMLLVWETSEQAIAWTRLPEHDVVSAAMHPFTVRNGAPASGAPRGGYRVLDVTTR